VWGFSVSLVELVGTPPWDMARRERGGSYWDGIDK
jgi:hypothetical protein